MVNKTTQKSTKPKKYKVFKKKEAARVREYSLKKDVRTHYNVNFRNNTTHTFSIASKTDFEAKCSQD